MSCALNVNCFGIHYVREINQGLSILLSELLLLGDENDSESLEETPCDKQYFLGDLFKNEDIHRFRHHHKSEKEHAAHDYNGIEDVPIPTVKEASNSEESNSADEINQDDDIEKALYKDEEGFLSHFETGNDG